VIANDPAGVYDAMAPIYDEQLVGDDWMRSVLWSRYASLFQPGDRVLDVGCGTGIDAISLASRGIQVVGIDISPGMLAKFRQKVAESGLGSSVEIQVMDASEVGSLPPASFDGIVSAFAGLNTTPDLGSFASAAARLLRPGGRMVVHMLNRFSLWEWLGAVRRREWAAVRGLGNRDERGFSLEGKSIRLYLYHPREAYRRFFEEEFLLGDARGLGILRPPHTVYRIPQSVAETLGRLELALGRKPPFLNWGRFFVLEMVKRSQPDRSG
jgi:SAM-dependent methyltransferase